MPFKKGKSGNPRGRPRGSVNKITHDMRGAIQAALEGQIEQLGDMINEARHGIEIEKTMPDGTTVVGRFNADAAKAANIVLQATEYIIPKLQRVERRLEDCETEELVAELRKRLNGAAPPEPPQLEQKLDS